MCLLHGIDDELSPFSQSVQPAEELERRETLHEFYSYEGLSDCFSTSADNEMTQQVFQDSMVLSAGGRKATSRGWIDILKDTKGQD